MRLDKVIIVVIIVLGLACETVVVADPAQAQPAVTIPAPQWLNTTADSDDGDDIRPHLTTDGLGNWVAVWQSTQIPGQINNNNWDILVARSTNNGASWTDPAPLNSNAGGSSGTDTEARLATDRLGTWVAVWSSSDSLEDTLEDMIETDLDILTARFTFGLFARADLDDDDDVDGSDFLTFSNCFNGSQRPPLPGCPAPSADIDGDGDADTFDFMTFSNCFNGALNPPACP